MEKTIEIQLKEHGERIAEAIEAEISKNKKVMELLQESHLVKMTWFVKGKEIEALNQAVFIARTTK